MTIGSASSLQVVVCPSSHNLSVHFAMLCLCRKHAALGPVGQTAREYNTNGPDWWDRLDDLWPALSKYVHKFKRLKKRYKTPDDVRRFQASRPMTLMHGDLHPANAIVTRTGGQAPSDGGVQVAIFDWAEINVSSGAEELAHFILRSRFYEDVSSNADGRNKQCVQLSHSYTRAPARSRCLVPR
jgi:aminoglycoside phosphotransferase (APT) family kinase protein